MLASAEDQHAWDGLQPQPFIFQRQASTDGTFPSLQRTSDDGWQTRGSSKGGIGSWRGHEDELVDAIERPEGSLQWVGGWGWVSRALREYT